MFGTLKVIEFYRKKGGTDYYRCMCTCGSEIIKIMSKYNLYNNNFCYCKKCGKFTLKNKNTYDMSGNYGIGYTSKGDKFYFDKEDYELIKSYTWCKRSDGYIITSIDGSITRQHRILFGEEIAGLVVDHINHNTTDNRRSNLRICTQHKNSMNNIISKNNTSGTSGVSFSSKSNSWRAYIMLNRKQINLGFFKNIEDAIKARKDAEEKYFGEYKNSYDADMPAK